MTHLGMLKENVSSIPASILRALEKPLACEMRAIFFERLFLNIQPSIALRRYQAYWCDVPFSSTCER